MIYAKFEFKAFRPWVNLSNGDWNRQLIPANQSRTALHCFLNASVTPVSYYAHELTSLLSGKIRAYSRQWLYGQKCNCGCNKWLKASQWSPLLIMLPTLSVK